MPEPVTNGCTGLCCAAFALPHTIRDLKARARQRAIVDSEGDPAEGDKIADMVIPLTPKEARERNRRFGGDAEFSWSNRGRHFTCRHWDEETRLCGIYDDRPSMCRGFPYEREDGCPFGCGCKGEAIQKGCSGAA